MQHLGGKPQKKLQNKGLSIRPALRTLRHQLPDPPPEGKTSTVILAAVAEIPSLCPRAFSGERKVLQEDRGQIMHQRASHAVQCHVQGAESQNEPGKLLPTGQRKA